VLFRCVLAFYVIVLGCSSTEVNINKRRKPQFGVYMFSKCFLQFYIHNWCWYPFNVIQIYCCKINHITTVHSLHQYETLDFHIDEDSRCFLGCDTVPWCGNIPVFQMAMLPPSSGLWHHLVMWQDTNISEDYADTMTSWRWKQHGPLKWWYPTMSLHSVTTQKTSTWNTSVVYYVY